MASKCRVCKTTNSLLTNLGLCPTCHVYFLRNREPGLFSNGPRSNRQGCVKCGDGYTNLSEYCPSFGDCDWFLWSEKDFEFSSYAELCDCPCRNADGEIHEAYEHSGYCEAFRAYKDDEPTHCGFSSKRHIRPSINQHGWCATCALAMNEAIRFCPRCAPDTAIKLVGPAKEFCSSCNEQILTYRTARHLVRGNFKDAMEFYSWALPLTVKHDGLYK